MSCKLYIPFSVSADHLLKSVQIQASKFQAKFDGNENSGDFKVRALGGTFKGNYVIQGQILQLNITTKPFLIPCSAIFTFLQNHLK